MTVQSPSGYPPPPPPAPPAQKKGMGPLAWVLIGCGVIIVLCIIAFAGLGFFVKNKIEGFKKNPTAAAAKLVVTMNPDLDLVSEDDAAGTMTIHNKKTNETLTLNFDDIKNGKMKFSSDKGSGSLNLGQNGLSFKGTDDKGQVSTFTAGTTTAQDMPSWLPAYPGATVQGGIAANSSEGSMKSFTLTTTDSANKVLSFYQDQLKSNGLDVQPSTITTVGGGTTNALVSAKSADGKRSVQIIVVEHDGKTQASLTYEEKK